MIWNIPYRSVGVKGSRRTNLPVGNQKNVSIWNTQLFVYKNVTFNIVHVHSLTRILLSNINFPSFGFNYVYLTRKYITCLNV